MPRFAQSGDALEVELRGGESIRAARDAMVYARGPVHISGQMGGLLSAVTRLVMRETFFLQTLSAPGPQPATVLLAAKAPGNVATINTNDTGDVLLRRGAFLAAEAGLELNTVMQSSVVKGFFSGSGFFLLRSSGRGQLALAAYGTIHCIDLKPGELLVVDTGHVLAWTAQTDYSVDFAHPRSLLTSFTSGEMLVCRFQGPGRVYAQTHTADGMSSWLRSMATGEAPATRGAVQCTGFFGCVLFLFVMLCMGIMLASLAFAAFSMSDDAAAGGTPLREQLWQFVAGLGSGDDRAPRHGGAGAGSPRYH